VEVQMTTTPRPPWWSRRLGRGTAADLPPSAPGGDLLVPRRWPWALLAAVLGAGAGAGAAALARRSSGERPGAQEPHELRAVVDRPAPETLP
jgi:hypothetical protein